MTEIGVAPAVLQCGWCESELMECVVALNGTTIIHYQQHNCDRGNEIILVQPGTRTVNIATTNPGFEPGIIRIFPEPWPDMDINSPYPPEYQRADTSCDCGEYPHDKGCSSLQR